MASTIDRIPTHSDDISTHTSDASPARSPIMNRALWIVQVLLGLFFALGSGAPKLLLPADALPMPIPLPHAFILFIGVAEVAGGLGLILPGLTRIRPGLTPLAAGGLVLVTIGATVYQLAAGQPGNAVFAVAIGLIAAFVGFGRWILAPHRASTRWAVLQQTS
jgi:uncharacterized membrane protein